MMSCCMASSPAALNEGCGVGEDGVIVKVPRAAGRSCCHSSLGPGMGGPPGCAGIHALQVQCDSFVTEHSTSWHVRIPLKK